MIEDNSAHDTMMNKLALRHLDIKTVQQSPVAQTAMKEVIRSLEGTPEYLELVRRYEVKSENPNLLQLAIDRSTQPIGKDAAGLLLYLGGGSLAWKVINGNDSTQAIPYFAH
jgi:hypothetical protein